jgi:chromosome segregation protein
LADALRQRATLAEGESVITRDGVWIGAHWLRIHKSDDPQMGVLVRSEEIEDLERAIAATTSGVEEASRTLASVRDSLEDFEKRRATAQLVANEKQQAYAEARTKLDANRAHFEETRKRAKALEASISGLAADQRTIEAALLESRKQLRDAGARRAELERDRERLDRERRTQQEDLGQARKHAEHDRAAAQEIAIQVETRRSSKESASAALTRIQTQHQHLLKRQTELNAQLEATVAPLASEERTLVEKLDERLTVEGELSSARAEVEQSETLVRDAEVRRGDQQKVVAEAREGVEAVRMSAREAQVRAETVAEQFGKTGFELDALSSGLPETANITEWTDRLDQIDKRVQRLGAINLAAIEEYAEQSQRKEYLDKQFVDLTEALETLENAIRKIDRETRARFKETFDNANQGLGRIFPRLFGGGHAYLELDSEDLLSAGVTIMARPPGKKISTIHLMSGGEKALTAVALVFSIFELNPAPFCLLDEVDAPLDDANVGRFSEIVREMSSRVQFVLITHNKTTMEAMNQLAGVTMQEPGVSRLVAVDIDEAVQLAAM